MIREQLIFPLLKEICEEEQIAFIEEPSRGMYGAMIFEDGSKFFVKDVNLNLNPVSTVRITKNKALTSYFLDVFHYHIPKYTMVYSEEKCRKYGLEDDLEKGIAFAKQIGYPVILKVNDSSKGRGIYKVHQEEELVSAMEMLLQNTNTFQIQKYYDYNDYRIVVLGNEVISAYQRVPLHVVGDGELTIRQLLHQKQEAFVRGGRDTIIDMDNDDMKECLSRHGYTMNTVLGMDEKCVLRTVSNLSAGGECVELTNRIHDSYRKLCINIARDFNLNLSGIDIMCEDICSDMSDYIILEINSAPGLDNYAYEGEAQRVYVKELYRKVVLFIKEHFS